MSRLPNIAAVFLTTNILLPFCLWPFLAPPPVVFPQITESHLLRQSRIIMGTDIEIIIAQGDPWPASQAMEEAFQEIERIDRLMSTYRSESEVWALARSAGKREIKVSRDTFTVIERALYFSRLSGGAFDITMAPLFRLWDFKNQKIPSAEEIKRAKNLVGYPKIKIKPATSEVYLSLPGMAIDLGAIAKGYAVDKAAATLHQRGIENFLINAGGDLKGQGEKAKGIPWIIGLKHPRLSPALIAKIHLPSAALATSGDYEKFFIKNGERYHHLLNPLTGQPARQCQSVTIMALSAMDADALATTLFILGPDKGFALIANLPDIHALIVDQRGRVLISPHWSKGVINPP